MLVESGTSSVFNRLSSASGSRNSRQFSNLFEHVLPTTRSNSINLVQLSVSSYSKKIDNDDLPSASNAPASNAPASTDNIAGATKRSASERTAFAAKNVSKPKLKKFISKNDAPLTGAKANLNPVDIYSWLYISNLSPDQWVDDIVIVLKELGNTAAFTVEKPAHLNKKPTSSTFVIKLPFRFESAVCKPNFWPANTYVNRYFFS